ncbi:Transcriptional regulatory protein TdiR [Usitatibacter rugosus]|uniref:Transcriptional regulatory protein TdiR n=2 Tax=Usitatibacter rugosus TaxID=2732067 RepID=A0A6M4GZ76_9PROT|nr:Transcriptional regulatory protein TdiR [Usitatibacter rugosus]
MPRSIPNAVIVVEDDASVSQALMRILRLAGLNPIVYSSAETLLDGDSDWDAACLIIDIQLPGLNGFALRDRLAAMRQLPPVIFMTAFDEPEARAQATSVGAFAFLSKPFSGRALLDLIERAVAASRASIPKGVPG